MSIVCLSVRFIKKLNVIFPKHKHISCSFKVIFAELSCFSCSQMKQLQMGIEKVLKSFSLLLFCILGVFLIFSTL